MSPDIWKCLAWRNRSHANTSSTEMCLIYSYAWKLGIHKWSWWVWCNLKSMWYDGGGLSHSACSRAPVRSLHFTLPLLVVSFVLNLHMTSRTTCLAPAPAAECLKHGIQPFFGDHAWVDSTPVRSVDKKAPSAFDPSKDMRQRVRTTHPLTSQPKNMWLKSTRPADMKHIND